MPDNQAAAPAQGAETTVASETPAAQPATLLDKIVADMHLGQTPAEQRLSKEWIVSLIEQVMQGQVKVSKDTEKMFDDRIRQLDELISIQLNEVMHAPEFQKLEAAWRGLHYFVFQSETSTMLKIKVMNVSKKDLLNSLTKVSEFDQSTIFKKVYEEEYGTLGGQPFGTLIGDYEFTRHPEDITLLEKMSNVAAASHAPFISSASPTLFNLNSYAELSSPRDLAKTFDNDAYIQWRQFRNSDDSKYVGLCLPRVLMRLPYGKDTVPVSEFDYDEKVDGRDHSKYLWGNAAYAFAARLTDAFARHEWCAAIRGVEGGGLVEGLPLHNFMTDEGDQTVKCPTELAITDRREKELSGLGFLPICYYKRTANAVFMGGQSVNKPKQYLDSDATANSNLSARLPYMFAVSRFAHFLKVMMRDKIGRFMSREEVEAFLNKWIANYVLLDDSAGQEAKAKFPLRAARIEVVEDKSNPGVYRAVAFLRPHFQLEELTVSLRLVARLPEPKG